MLPAGFTRSGNIWTRRFGEYTDVIDVQRSGHTYSMTLNAGVLDPVTNEICWGAAEVEPVKEWQCTVRIRAGRLRDGKELWWDSGGEEAYEEQKAEVSEYLLPFIDSMHSPVSMRDYLANARHLDPVERIYLMILEQRTSNSQGAQCALAELLRLYPVWSDRALTAVNALAQTSPIDTQSLIEMIAKAPTIRL